MAKLIKAVFGAGQTSKTCPQWQYDYNTILQFVGLDLPTTFEVDLANSKTGQSTTVLGDADGCCTIPAQFFIPGTSIFAWAYIVDSNSGYTRCQVEIPISPRAQHTGDPPTPAQQSALDEAIAALNAAAENIPSEIESALQEAKESGEFDGDPGASAYQIAVDHGYEGTEAEWLESLHGQDATVDATLTQAGEAADAAAAGAGIAAAQHSADYAKIYAESLNSGAGIPLDTEWALYGISDSRAYRIHSVDRITAIAQTVLQISAGYRFYLRIYREGGYSDTSWYGPAYSSRQTYPVPAGTDYRVVIGAYPEDSSVVLTDEDVGTYAAQLSIVNNIGSGGGSITVDDEISGSSENPVQNKVIAAALDEKADSDAIPTKTSELQNDSGFLTQHQDISGKLNIAQGSGNAGKFLVVGNDGNVTTMTLATWQGGNY